jgi:replicative DNA helicase
MNTQPKPSNITPFTPKLTQGKTALDTPHSELLERSVLAAMFTYPNFAHKVIAEIGNHKAFFFMRYQMIFDAIAKTITPDAKPDTVTVSEQLLADGHLVEVGGPAELTMLIAEFRREEFGTPDLGGYITGLKDYYARWQLLKASDELKKQAYDMTVPPDKTVFNAQSTLSTVSEFVLSDVFTPLSTNLQRHADHTERSGDVVMTLPTHIPNLDNLINGLQRKKVCVIAGRAHHAKTSVSISVCLNIARDGGRVVIFNVADGDEHDVLSRIIAMESGISFNQVRTGNIHPNSHGRYIEAMRKIAKMGITIRSVKGMTMPQLQAEARAISGVNGIDLIFIDYIQRLTVDTSNPAAPRDSYSQMAHISQSITKIAEQLNVPILVAAQINRSGNGKMPDVNHIKGCGNIEEDADMVLLVHRDWLDNNDHPFPQQIQIKVGKNKVNGELGTVLCEINPLSTYVKSKQ